MVIVTLLLSFVLQSCNSRRVDITATQRREFTAFQFRRNLTPPMIDRSPLDGPPPITIPADLPKSGFSTRYVRGADPFPSETLSSMSRAGVFRFDFRTFLATENPANILSAILSIEEAVPDREVAIRWAEPWVDSGSGLIYSRPRDTNLRTADFGVRAVTEAWEPSTTAAQGRIASAPLNRYPRGANFKVPMASGRSFNVTDEVNRFFITSSRPGQRNFGFVIEPASIQLLYKTNNSLNVGFRVRLILLMRE